MITLHQLQVLLAVHVAGDDSYGVNVAGLIKTHCHREVKRSIYVTLHSLRDRGLLQAYVAGEGTPRPFYSVTAAGHAEVLRTLTVLNNLVVLYRKVSNAEASNRRNDRRRAHQGAHRADRRVA